MWRKQRNSGRDQFRENHRGNERGNICGHGGRDKRDIFPDRNREDHYNDHLDENKHLRDWDQIRPGYPERGVMVYNDDRERLENDYRGNVSEDIRYRDDRSRHDEDYYDTREVTGVKREDFGATGYSSQMDDERAMYADRRHLVGSEQEWEGNRHQYDDDQEPYRVRELHSRDDTLAFRSDKRDDYREQEQVDFRGETLFRDDRDFQSGDNRQYLWDQNRQEGRWDDRNRISDTDRFPRNEGRRSMIEEEKRKSQGKRLHGGTRDDTGQQKFAKTVAGDKDRFGRRMEGQDGHNRGKITGNKSYGSNNRSDELQRQREDSKRSEKKNVKRNIERNQSSEISRSGRHDSSRSRNSNQTDKRYSEDLKKHQKVSEERHTKSRSSSSKDRNKSSDISGQKSVKTQSKLRSESEDRNSSRSRSSSNRYVKKDSEKKSKEVDSRSRTDQYNRGHNSDIKVEANTLYASFHEDDAISILVDDDRFANETRKYSEPDNYSVGKFRIDLNVRDHAKESFNEDTFQIHADSSASIFADNDPVRQREDPIFKAPAADGYLNSSRSRSNKDTISKRNPNQHSDRNSRDKNKLQSRRDFWKSRNFGAFNNRSRFSKQRAALNKGQQRNFNRPDKANENVAIRIGRTGAVLSEDRGVRKSDKGRTRDVNNKRGTIGRTGAVLSNDREVRNDVKSGRVRGVNNKRGTVGRTGAVLSTDRKVRNNNEQDRARGVNNKTETDRNIRNQKGNTGVRASGISDSNRVKRKYFKKSFKSQGNLGRQNHNGSHNLDSDRKERFSKLRNERDRRDFEKRKSTVNETTSQDDLAPSDQGQQLILIPNPDMHDGQAPFLDQFGNADVPVGSVQQLPLQFIPQNLAPEMPQGTEYVFIPFVNDQLGGQLSGMNDLTFNQTVLNDGNLVGREFVGQNEQDGLQNYRESKVTTVKEASDTTTRTSRKAELRAKALKNKNRLLKIRKERRIALEKRLERRVFARLIRETKESIKAEAALQRAETKTKPVIKRISPPVATVNSSYKQPVKGHRQQEDNNMDPNEYDNISDLEDITDDEIGEMNDDARIRAKFGEQKRTAFRKPGEPRKATRGRSTFDTSNVQRSSDAWKSADVRKVVDLGSPQNSSISSANVTRLGDNSLSKRGRPRTPIQITVNNDQYAVEEGNYGDNSGGDFAKNANSQRRGQIYKEQNTGHFVDSQRRGGDMYGRYRKGIQGDQSKGSEGWERPGTRGRQSTEHGKYNDEIRNIHHQRKSRYSDTDQSTAQRNPGQNVSTRNRQSTNSREQVSNANQRPSQKSTNNATKSQTTSPFAHNQLKQKFSVPLSQYQIQSKAQSQFNVGQSFPVGIQQVGFNQFNASDPSLPPVSQGTVNISPFPLSGLAAHPDMSMPPTVAAPPSDMSGVILPQRNVSQQNFHMQKPFLQHQQQILSGVQQVQQLSQQQQIQINQNMAGGVQFQTNLGMDQQRTQFHIQENQLGNRNSSMSTGSHLYQQNQLQMSSQSGSIQQQAVMGGVGSLGMHQQARFQNNQQSQLSRPGMLSQMAVSSDQTLISGLPATMKDSFHPAKPSEALQNMGNLSTSMVSNQGYVAQNYPHKANNPKLFGTERGSAGLVKKVPRTSLQVSSTAGSGQSSVHQISDTRRAKMDSNVGKPPSESGTNSFSRDGRFGTGLGISRVAKGHSQDTFGLCDDDEFGELLCVKCDKVFLSESVMRRHSKWHILVEAGVRELRCDICEQGFTSSVAFDAHIAEKHRGNSWRCERCELTFTNRSALVKHNQIGHYDVI